MKKNKMFITVIVCLLPIILGIVLYNKLPDEMPIHFTFNNEPDNYGPKWFALFGIPVIMAFIQFIVVIAFREVKDEKTMFIRLSKWIIPVVTVLVYLVMLGVPLSGTTSYVGKSICFIVGMLFIVTGNYIPKVDYETGKNIFNPRPKDEKAFRKMSRIMGYSMVTLGIVFLVIMLFV